MRGLLRPRDLADRGRAIRSPPSLFILGLKRMSSPVTARSGIVWAGAGMLVATLVTLPLPRHGATTR